ncbi:M13 family metallopeptidase [Aestuariicella hydrocarbonica]|uniref:M13 family metallopeptidase n=1 Tax=Pseudomaricurvus hydrocarbonicus TaxID=1470433 RepID=A0A9E5JPK1_9GAMM|nr:M13 family metallopeptidase [Aestuariicella hydrocarbonica]NHO64233.1 M13 family metallopeptidase [Aestuariicella hydrocarbonica]
MSKLAQGLAPWGVARTQVLRKRIVRRALSVSGGLCMLMLGGFVHSQETTPELDTRPMLGDWGVETQYFSQTLGAGDDFYRFVNEGWLKAAQIPQGFSRIDAFVEVYLRTEAQIRTLLDDVLDGGAGEEAGGRQIQGLYKSYMDVERIETLGLAPIQKQLDAVWKTTTHEQIARLMAQPMQHSPVGVGIGLDDKHPDHYALLIGQSGLGLPDRLYYLDEGEPYASVRQHYVALIKGTLARAGIDQVSVRADQILAFETAIAKLHWTPEQQRDRLKNYAPMNQAELMDYAPGFEWRAFMEQKGVSQAQRLVVNTNTAVQGIASLVGETAVNVLQSYLAFHLIDNYAPLLSEEYAQANFDFYSRTLGGIAERRPRELRAQSITNDYLGELMGQLYVERYFPAQKKASMEHYIHYIREAFRQRIQHSPWMDEQTQAEAFKKLDSFGVKVGYPDQWRDFSQLVIKANDLVGNVQRLQAWYWADSRSKLDEPRRQWEWMMNPQEINAYYSSSRNEIVFPAAILQPPFFDVNADPAVNFAAIGGVIGHEMGHGFDDQGSLSDGQGVLRNWWTPEARKRFEERAQVLVKQYSQYEPLEGLRLSGQLTLGENIGDLGGLTLAYTAYRNFVAQEQDGKAPVLDGWSGDQRFFFGWAQVWRSKMTQESLRQMVVSNPHSPAKYRVNGVMRNMDAWYDAFSVTDQNTLYLPPGQRVHIW